MPAGVDQVLEALATVIDPDLKKDIVSMGMIKDLEMDGGRLKFTLELTTPACPFNAEIEDDVRKAVGGLDGITGLDLNVTAKVMEGRSLDDDTGMATVKNIIGVASGKGGVGKSTVSLNLALALSREGAKVGLLDADIYGPSIPLMLGMKEAFMQVENNKLQPVSSHGIRVVSFGFFAEQEHSGRHIQGPHNIGPPQAVPSGHQLGGPRLPGSGPAARHGGHPAHAGADHSHNGHTRGDHAAGRG